MDRRKFIGDSVKAAASITVVNTITANAAVDNSFNTLRFAQEPLPYALDALEPHIDARTMDIHYGRHHAAYVKNANEALDAENIKVETYEALFAQVVKYSAKCRNNAGGVWNHNFFWKIMKPAGGAPTGKVAEALTGTFGSVDAFKEKFTAAAIGRFGSGWAWLVKQNGQLKIGSTPNQDNPLMSDAELQGVPLLAIDVWEHAYYLKYQNLRKDYISAWWNLVNWEAVAAGL